METLYDLLGALPNDDADELRAAFRRAVKRVHPDINSEDLDAGLKFRRIVRANEILGDAEQFERRPEVTRVVLFTATVYITLNLAADLAYFLVNPRMRG